MFILKLVPAVMGFLFRHLLSVVFRKQYSDLLYFSPVCLTSKGYLPFWLLIKNCLKCGVYDVVTSWSEMPGITDMFSTRPALFVQNRSKMAF